MELSSLKNKIKKLPKSPGAYIFKDKSGRVLYVGKAANLKTRVQSYFSGQDERLTIGRMMPQVEKVETKETESVLEALILESSLIKKHHPKYNVLGKDDKSFAYFVITNEEFPRILIIRKTDLEKNSSLTKEIYGPYVAKHQMDKALKIIRKIFPFHSSKQKTEKGCLDYQIGRCPGPYAGEIPKRDYMKNIKGIKMILEGKKKGLIRKLEKEMKDSAKRHEFEKAAEIRNRVFALRHIQDVALISEDSRQLPAKSWRKIRVEAYDISNISGQHAAGSMVVFENNEMNKPQYRKFKIKTISGADDVGMMKEVLERRLRNDWPLPDLMLLDGGKGHLSMGAELLRNLKLKIPIVAVTKGPTRKKQELIVINDELSKEIKNILEDRMIIKRIMDEAHRFAIAYHRKLRKNIK